jgi:hypothetical protein
MWDMWWTSGTEVGFVRVLRFLLPITPLTAACSSSYIARDRYNRPNSGRRTNWTQSHPSTVAVRSSSAICAGFGHGGGEGRGGTDERASKRQVGSVSLNAFQLGQVPLLSVHNYTGGFPKIRASLALCPTHTHSHKVR